MAEWLKAHDWKSCEPKGSEGSNPSFSAISGTLSGPEFSEAESCELSGAYF